MPQQSKLYILPRIHDIPKTSRQWNRFIADWHDEIVVACGSIEKFEEVIVYNIVRYTLDFGNFSGHAHGWNPDSEYGGLDGSAVEDIIEDIFNGDDPEIPNSDAKWNLSRYMSLELTDVLCNLRMHYHRSVCESKFSKIGINMGVRRITNIVTTLHTPNGDWFVGVDFDIVDTGLPLSPTEGEFRTLMFYWQAKYGKLVGNARSEEAAEHDATYIGRNVNQFTHLNIPDVPMGNPYSSLAHSVVRYDTFDERGIDTLEVTNRLTACLAYYLKSVRDLIAAGNEDDQCCNRVHWVRFYNLQDEYLACHCGNYTDRKAATRFCHGLVIHALADTTAGHFDIADNYEIDLD